MELHSHWWGIRPNHRAKQRIEQGSGFGGPCPVHLFFQACNGQRVFVLKKCRFCAVLNYKNAAGDDDDDDDESPTLVTLVASWNLMKGLDRFGVVF